MQNEIWKDIPEFPGYQVSNAGCVRSLRRIVKRGNFTMNIPETILRFGSSMGYYFVNLRKDGKSISIKVHKLVGLVFVENPLNRPEIDHINTNRKDNRPENCMNPITRKKNSIAKTKRK